MESPPVQLEIVNLLKEIKDLLKAGNDQLDKGNRPTDDGSEPASSVTAKIAVRKSTRQSQSDGSPSSSESSRSPWRMEESFRMQPDGAGRTRYYDEFPAYHPRIRYVHDYVNNPSAVYHLVERR